MNNPAIAFSAPGIGLRRGFGAFGAAGVAGTSALIGRVIDGNANAWHAYSGWLVGQLNFSAID
jgi:hypothetical protein